MSIIIFSFIFWMLIFTLVGIASVFKSKKNSKDYLLAGSNVPPYLVALSAVATNNSGFMFAGMIGVTYSNGISSLWLIVPWIFGDFLASLWIHRRLRIKVDSQDASTFPAIISMWHGQNFVWVRRLSAVIIIFFLGTYAAAQLSAGGKALHAIFDWDYKVGAVIGAVIVVVYCFSGGIRASIWTDAVQSIVMFVAMITMLGASIYSLGGFDAFVEKLSHVSPDYLSLTSAANAPKSIDFGQFGPLMGTLSLVAGYTIAGLGVVGQPHIMVRFMAMNKPKDIRRVRVYYYSWYLSFTLLTIGVGLASRLLLQNVGDQFDSELALPTLAKQILPSFWVGLVLAGLFAATMSTADSQILSCAASFTRDLEVGKKSYLATKIGTLLTAVLALFIAIFISTKVLSLVLVAWSALASSFTPIIVLYTLGFRMSQPHAISTILGGLLGMIAWRVLGFSDLIYDAVPGMFSGFLVFFLGKMFFKKEVETL